MSNYSVKSTFDPQIHYIENNINMLFFNHKPRSTNEITTLLDSGDYKGRHVVQVARKDGAPSSLVKVAVTLPHSGFTYHWPHENYYNLLTKKLHQKVKIKYDLILDQVMGEFIGNSFLYHPNQNIGAIITNVSGMLGFGIFRIQPAVDQLVKFGLVVNGTFQLKEYVEIYEIYHNMFNNRMYNFLT